MVGRAEINGELVPFHIGERGEVFVDVDMKEGDHLIIYSYEGDLCCGYAMYHVLATAAGEQLRWSKAQSRDLSEPERQSLKAYLPRRTKGY